MNGRRPTSSPSPGSGSATHRGARRFPAIGSETLVLLACVYLVGAFNRPFWTAALAGHDLTGAAGWQFAATLFTFLVAAHFVLIAPFAGRRLVRPVLLLLIAASAAAAHYMEQYGVYVDPDMMRNVLHTDRAEAAELLDGGLLLRLALFALPPALLIARMEVKTRTALRATAVRLGSLVMAAAVAVGALVLMFHDFSALMRNHKEVRYLITPANLVYSGLRAASSNARGAVGARQQVGTDAALGPGWQGRARPVLMIVVVGETARGANWGLNGYARQTTPKLAALDVLNFRRVTSCGTNTETSVPCMFSPYGRRAYDEERIRGSESLLHVLARAGLDVVWLDNQSGCKGVCQGIETPERPTDPALCDGERCLDEILLHRLENLVAHRHERSLVVVLHQLGNHGPAYYRRYPERLRRFTPTCDTAELSQCSREQIVNSYDNALLYTDEFLAGTIAFLDARRKAFDTALLYVSDHGESLGENGLYLHGMPYAIAPREQTEVPMLLWLSEGFAHSTSLDLECLRTRTEDTASHDNLFHTVLGLLDVSTTSREEALDLSKGCRRARGRAPG